MYRQRREPALYLATMADPMAMDREMNHLIVGNMEEISEQKSNREKIHDNTHYGQGVHSVKTF